MRSELLCVRVNCFAAGPGHRLRARDEFSRS